MLRLICFLTCSVFMLELTAAPFGNICPQSKPCNPLLPAPAFCQKILSDPDIKPLLQMLEQTGAQQISAADIPAQFPEVCVGNTIQPEKIAENLLFLKISTANLCLQFQVGRESAGAYHTAEKKYGIRTTLATEAANRVLCNARYEGSRMNNLLQQTVSLANAYSNNAPEANCANFRHVQANYTGIASQCDTNMSCQWDWMNFRNQELSNLASSYGQNIGNLQLCTPHRLCSFKTKVNINEPDCFWPGGKRP